MFLFPHHLAACVILSNSLIKLPSKLYCCIGCFTLFVFIFAYLVNLLSATFSILYSGFKSKYFYSKYIKVSFIG
nr:MAG TPA: hypothetical protein [Caudoviricetes sp.]DAX02831.1 MAG TPA: hypothetical protein [Caudoviricetes sp.]